MWIQIQWKMLQTLCKAPIHHRYIRGEDEASRRDRSQVAERLLLQTPDVNSRLALQALGVILRCFARQRLVSVERKFFSIDGEELVPLHGGAELRRGYHQAVRVADHKLLLKLDKTTLSFYTPGNLTELVTATLGARSPSEISVLTYGEQRKLARALRRIEVTFTHRTGISHRIYASARRRLVMD